MAIEQAVNLLKIYAELYQRRYPRTVARSKNNAIAWNKMSQVFVRCLAANAKS